MTRPAVEFLDYKTIESQKIDGLVEGLSERVISQDDKGENLARVLEFQPGTDTTPNGVQTHDYWEEIYIIEGSVVDLTLNQTFSKGMVASRPPGMKHGPWKTSEGCIMYEVRYYK